MSTHEWVKNGRILLLGSSSLTKDPVTTETQDATINEEWTECSEVIYYLTSVLAFLLSSLSSTSSYGHLDKNY